MAQWNASPPRSAAVAYLLWFFLGGLGIHRFYLRQPRTAVIMLVLTVLGYITTVFVVGLLLLAVVGVWWIADAFLIPGLVRQANGLGGFVTADPAQGSVPTASIEPPQDDTPPY